jgi:hypothetical protein
MIENPKNQPGTGSGSPPDSGAPTADAARAHGPAREKHDGLTLPHVKPWEDQSLSPEDRLQAYKGFVFQELESIRSAIVAHAGQLDRQLEIKDSSETQRWFREGEWLVDVRAEDFCKEMDRRMDDRMVPGLLGKNFLGPAEWMAQGIGVGEVPPIPASITKELLESECPLHPGEKIKDTHLLVLVPKTVNGEPFSPLKLDELCSTRKGSGDRLIYAARTSWKRHAWASAPQSRSEWVLLPKSDLDPSKVASERHFRSKRIAQQDEVQKLYPDYREVKTVELMTAVLLYDLTHKERLLPDYLRCEEPNASGGRVCVGFFDTNGLEVDVGNDADVIDDIGRALARKTI